MAGLGGVAFMDSSGINVFLAAHRQVSGAQGRPHVLRPAAMRPDALRP
ncbi:MULTISPECIES: hypothetical protein [unclassified Streptomyces]|nr:hypothetical protein [Streptomyces sp. Root1310]